MCHPEALEDFSGWVIGQYSKRPFSRCYLCFLQSSCLIRGHELPLQQAHATDHASSGQCMPDVPNPWHHHGGKKPRASWCTREAALSSLLLGLSTPWSSEAGLSWAWIRGAQRRGRKRHRGTSGSIYPADPSQPNLLGIIHPRAAVWKQWGL